jgi:homoserine O-succinyltransferase
MPIYLHPELPAFAALIKEGLSVSDRAQVSNAQPIRVAVLNLMPNKIETEIQLGRLLAKADLPVEVTWLQTATYTPRHTPKDHLDRFYLTYGQVKDRTFDGLIITGAPLGLFGYEQVTYWDELETIMDWAQDSIRSTLFICWASYAGLYHHYGVQKYLLDEKCFGVYDHRLTEAARTHPITRGMRAPIPVPHSHVVEVRQSDLEAITGVQVLSVSDQAGLYLAATADARQVYVLAHPEYDRLRLKVEYERDLGKGLPIAIPAKYFPDNNPDQPPQFSWHAHACALYANWLSVCDS